MEAEAEFKPDVLQTPHNEKLHRQQESLNVDQSPSTASHDQRGSTTSGQYPFATSSVITDHL
ncbi:hypothetical protein K443DRAFT_680304 [Laccaria amethystina LaAM-08-1]|jgi:hypothetical protein|uniref:Uncharacterized protein n=1 Tax=Laccaria amethystina LaAM-08-1 TaxID=1095629 RepID=A0A0C9XNB9_9AGAR|nr:hypothetical protein K443DRAFT_680304 [Laccaria amethystina LaAM-08-1]